MASGGTAVTALTLLVGALAVARVSHLITEDTILDRPRDWLLRRAPDGKVATLVTCPWCVSVWIGAASYVWWAAHPESWWPPAVVATWSYVTGWLESH